MSPSKLKPRAAAYVMRRARVAGHSRRGSNTMSYIQVPADRLRAKLAEMGFSLAHDPHSREEIYERTHHRDPSYFVRVYSSIEQGSRNTRGCGEDAIRVVALRRVRTADWREGKQWRIEGIAKTKRIHRTGTVEGVLERLHERAREAYAVINQRLKGNKQAVERV